MRGKRSACLDYVSWHQRCRQTVCTGWTAFDLLLFVQIFQQFRCGGCAVLVALSLSAGWA
jgi:hypothetical protein